MRRSYRYVVMGDIGQWLGLGCLLIAFGFMIADDGHNYEMLIMISSVVFAIGTKIKYYGRKRLDKIMACKRRALIHIDMDSESNNTRKERRK